MNPAQPNNPQPENQNPLLATQVAEPTIAPQSPPPVEEHVIAASSNGPVSLGGGNSKKYLMWGLYGLIGVCVAILVYLALAKFYLNTWPFEETVAEAPVIQQNTLPVTSPVATQSATAKPELSLAQINQQFSVVGGNSQKYEGNKDMENQTKPYKSEMAKISFDIPYNNNWGTDKFMPKPYEERIMGGQYYVLFGPVDVFCEGDCAWSYKYSFHTTEQKSSATLIAELKKQYAQDPKSLTAQTENIGDKEVVIYEVPGMCTVKSYEVIGKVNNYNFGAICGDGSQMEDDYIRKSIATVKFLD